MPLKERKTYMTCNELLIRIDTYLEEEIDQDPVDLTELLKLIRGDEDNLRLLELGIKIGFLDMITFIEN